MSKAWVPTSFNDICKRAAGRRRYHAGRQRAQFTRQLKVLKELQQANWENYGLGRRLAREFGVSEATVSRDIRHLRVVRIKMDAQGSEMSSAFADVANRLEASRNESQT
jgi:predicted DNA-binding transcriptional regulator YafY